MADINKDRIHAAHIAIARVAQHSVEQARSAHLDQAMIEGINRSFRQVSTALRGLMINWDLATAATVETFANPSLVNKPVRILAQLSEMTKPIQVMMPTSENDIITLLGRDHDRAEDDTAPVVEATVTIMGETGQQETLLASTDRLMNEAVAESRMNTAYFEILAVVVMVMVVKNDQIINEFRLLPVDMVPVTTALQLVAPTPGELQVVDDMRRDLKDPLAYIMSVIERELDIRGLDELPILREALEVQILSAASQGRRIHTALLGSPANGKSLVGRAAKALQPVAREALPTKITEAGLVGVGRSSARKDARSAGLVPQADQGVFVVQDWHQANGPKNQRLCSTLATVMQDGVVHDSSASRCSYRAETAVVIDANRRSDVNRPIKTSGRIGLSQLIDDVRIPLNLLTRFTYIAEIPRDIHAQLGTMNKLLAPKTSEK